MIEYTKEYSQAGIKAKLPPLECFPNQFKNYEITIIISEFTSVCPKTKQPDFGKIIIRYMPKKHCIELKSLKIYFQGYRNLGIFYENAVNKILDDFVRACQPRYALVLGKFNPRGGIVSIIKAEFPRKRNHR